MDYEIVNLEEKTVVGLSARTNNNSPEMGAVISGLWSRFFESGVFAAIENKSNSKSLGIYTDYEDDENKDYTVAAACEVTKAENIPAGAIAMTVPGGKYAKFIVRGNMCAAVSQFWSELWEMDLNRSFICDFEEYQNEDPENAEIHIYIGIKE